MNLLMIYSRYYQYRPYTLVVFLTVLAITSGIIAFPLTYVSNTNVLIGACLLPLAIFIHGKPQVNYGYLAFMLLFMTLAFLYHVRIFYFFTLTLYVLFLLEWKIGKAAPLILFLVVFMSPFFEQVAVILGFPVRLHLSSLASAILSAAHMNVQASGNVMLLDGVAFTVDQACMGLHLLSISMMMGVFVLAHRFRREKRSLPLAYAAAFFLHVFILNVLSNLFRITILVSFRIMPEDPMHDFIGILCLVMYVVVPIYFISGWMVKRFGRPLAPLEEGTSVPVVGKIIAIALGLCLVLLAFRINGQRNGEKFAYANVSVGSLKGEQTKGGVTKFFDKNILVYVKPIPQFFSGEHTPLICWKGSGYQFKGISTMRISGREIYMGTLVKADAALFTAWWYDNGKTITIDQMEWRMRMLQGENNFCLVNVTAESEATLLNNLQDLFNNKLIKISGKL